MHPRLVFIVLGLLASTVLFWSGCGRKGPLSKDPAVARREVDTLIPKGTSEARALKLLAARGFQLSRHTEDKGPNHLIVGSCAYDDFFWQVGMVIVDAHVAATTVNISDLRSTSK